MAHEIGHLLLGVTSHSREGIMSIPWDAKKLQQVDLGRLGFTKEQASKLNAEALRRAGGLSEGFTEPVDTSRVAWRAEPYLSSTLSTASNATK